jgi:hypothetical protein
VSERERRIGENEALFRSVNDQVRRLNATLSTLNDSMAIVCECADDRCLERIEIRLETYGVVHDDPTQFVVKPGHDAVEAEHVVAKRDDYWVVRKNPGLPAELARATAPGA